jgi:hypothetical protein
MARPKKPLEPLIPLDKLKAVVKGLIAVPKAEVDAKPSTAKRCEMPKGKPGGA